MAQRRKPFALLVAAMLLLAQWGAVRHELSHLAPDSFAPAGDHLPCGECIASTPLHAGMASAVTVAVALLPTVEALPPAFRFDVPSGAVRLAYRSRAPPA